MQPVANVVLKAPSVEYVESYFSAMAEFGDDERGWMPQGMTRAEFPAYVGRLHDQAEGKGLPDGYIPSKEFWMIDGDGFAGRIILGLTYYPSEERVGHHVGAVVRPSKRGRGYCTQALALMVEEARALGIPRLMPTCAPTNVGSQRVIARNGGVALAPAADGELRFVIEV